jgi:hypothetical protein
LAGCNQVQDAPTEIPTRVGLDGVIGEDYPPPPPPAPTSSPQPDARGIIPAPDGVVTDTTTIAESPWSHLLEPIKAALDARDSEALASFVREQTGEQSTQVYTDGGVAELWAGESQAGFDQLFAEGSEPIIQGYFASFEGDECIGLITTGWVGPAYLSTPSPSPPTATPPRPLMDRPGRLAQKFNGDTFFWQVCDWGSGSPLIMYWGEGGFHQIVTSHYAGSLDGPDPDWFKFTVVVP